MLWVLIAIKAKDANKENQDKNTPKARIVKNVEDQKNELQLRFGFWGGFRRFFRNFGIRWVEYMDPINLMDCTSNMDIGSCSY